MRAILATLLLVLISVNVSEAKPRKARAEQAAIVTCDNRGCSDWGQPVQRSTRSARRVTEHARRPQQRRAYAASQGGVPSRFVRGRLICAINVGVALSERGIKGTGSALAKSYLNWGRPSGPVPGAVAVFNRGKRGGHVAIVHSVQSDGTVIYLNPSSRRQAWQIGPYRKRPITYRVASL